MTIENPEFIEQRTQEWKEQRRGKFTASEIHKLMLPKGLGETGKSYVHKKVAEELGAKFPEISSPALRWGEEMEPRAKRYYEKAFNAVISDQPFIVAPWCEDTGCSPDGTVITFNSKNLPDGNRKGYECKCPYNPENHIANLTIRSQEEFKKLRTEYYWQIMHCMAVCNIGTWDFFSFFPDIDDPHKGVVIPIMADEKDILLLKERIFQAVAMKKDILSKIRM